MIDRELVERMDRGLEDWPERIRDPQRYEP